TLQWSQGHAVQASTTTRLVEGRLEVNLEALRVLLETDTRLQRVHLDLAHPGETCRIGRVCDVMAPRAKLEGGGDFPGVLGALTRAGSGRTQALANVAVVVTDQELPHPGSLALIDMAGPAAALTEFARTHNIVLSAWPAPGVERPAYLSAMRLAGLKAAVYLAQAARDSTPDKGEVRDQLAPPRVPAALQHLPRVAYVFQIHSHQRPTGIEEGILYGDPIRRMLPTIVHPNEVLDGAVLRGFMGRNATTYAIQNHP